MKTPALFTYRLLLIIILQMLFVCTSFAQQRLSWDDFIERFYNSDQDGNYDQQLLDELLDLYNDKININTATEEDLSVLPFLSHSQIKDIIYYRLTNEQFLTLGELMFVPSLDKDTRDFLRLFTYAGEISQNKTSCKQLWNNAKSEVTLRTDIPLYRQTGYISQYSKKNNILEPKAYLGSPLYESARYKLSSMNILDAGIVIEKDPGEKGIDHFSGYAMLSDIGHIKNIIVGNYKVSFGQGLVINNSSSFGKTMLTSAIGQTGKGFSKKSSTTESDYMTGGAISLKYNDFTYSTYLSHNRFDGTFNNDSTGITSLKTDGLHRTSLETSKKGNLGITDFGGNIQWSKNKLQLSATLAFTHYSHPLRPKHNTTSSLYRSFNAQGKNFYSYSISYAYRLRNMNFTGETASCNTGGLATINSLQWELNSYNSLTLIQRFYSYKYNSINGKCFGENSVPKNEEGLYIGWNSKPSRRVTFSSYIDAFYFPWLKYQVSNSSYGIEGMAQLTYSPKKNLDLSIRYKIKSKQKDYIVQQNKKDTIKVLQYNTNQSLRLTSNFTATKHITLKTSINGTMISFGPSPQEYGMSITQSIILASNSEKYKANVSATYFNTDSYNTRIYAYEPSLLYSFGLKSYYHKGMRLIALISVKPTQNLTLTGKLGYTHYFNKNTIGTGRDLIDANHKEDIQLQMRWKF